MRDMASTEHPIHSHSLYLYTKTDHRVRRYEDGTTCVEIKSAAKGLASCSQAVLSRATQLVPRHGSPQQHS